MSVAESGGIAPYKVECASTKTSEMESGGGLNDFREWKQNMWGWRGFYSLVTGTGSGSGDPPGSVIGNGAGMAFLE